MIAEPTDARQEVDRGDLLLDIVIVAHGEARELLRVCLESIESHPVSSGPSQVWVVDNATSDGTGEMLREQFPWARAVRLDRPCGFAAANNVVLRELTAPYVLMINPDTEVYEGSLDRALAALQGASDRGIVGVRLVRRDGSFDHAAKRNFPTVLGALAHFTGIGRAAGANGALAQYRAPEVEELGEGAVDAVNGAFMMVRRSALAEVGLLDEGYLLYGEDLDLCYRFKQAGWKVWYDGSATVLHVKGANTVEEHGGQRHRTLKVNYAFHHAMGRFYRKFNAGHNRALDAAVYMALAVKFFISVLRSAIARRSLV